MEEATNHRPSRGMSLEQKVPLLITGLLVALLSLTLAAAHREVDASARLAGDERLERIGIQLSGLVQSTVTQRLALLRSVADHPHVQAIFAAGVAPDTAVLRDLLEPLATPGDSTDRVELIGADGDVLFALGASSSVLGRVPREHVDAPEEGGYGRWVDTGEMLLTQAAEDVRVEGRTVGHVFHLRPFTNPAAAEQMEELVGQNSGVFFVEEEGESWVTLRGEVSDPPVTAVAGPLTYQRPDGEVYMARATPVPNTPWTIVAELPLAGVLVGPTAFLRRMVALLILITSLGAVAAWVLSRRFTRPLRELSDAAGTLASGDYSRRVSLDRTDELGMLAEAFNSMAAQVQGGDAELKQQIEQARELAREVAEANDQLLTLMEEAEKARRTAEAANHAKSDFLATVSHEIRTPINAIIGFTDLLLLGIPDPPTGKQAEQLERVRESGTRLTRLIDDVLDLAKIEAGHLKVDLAKGIAEDAIQAALTMTEPLAARKGIELTSISDLQRRTLYRGDPGRVEQIVVNLVGNAVKFTPPGGQVLLRCERSSESDTDPGAPASIRITVEDTGPGIPFEKQELIFDRFVQGDSGYRRAHEGAGLGLAISRELARLMGGDIVVQSDSGQGSAFTLILPAADVGQYTTKDSQSRISASAG